MDIRRVFYNLNIAHKLRGLRIKDKLTLLRKPRQYDNMYRSVFMENETKKRGEGKKEYICTSVSISKEEKDTFKPLSIFANSLYIPFLLEKAEGLAESDPYRIHNMGVKLSADKKDTYKYTE